MLSSLRRLVGEFGSPAAAPRRDAPLPRPAPRRPGDDPSPRVCRMIFDEICVLADGDIVCSCGDPAGLRVYGNVHRDRIADLYDGGRYREMRRWQLDSRPDSWCPVIGTDCAGRVSRPSADDGETGRTPKILQLEPISLCNLRCPECPTTNMEVDGSYRSSRRGRLSLETMLDVVDQLPDLEKLLFYNFGETFLHREAIPFLREVRRRRPDVVIHASTNGIPLSAAAIDDIASGALVDRLLFSIDGARPASYARYRVGGELAAALGALEAAAGAVRRAGTERTVDVVWQYILFGWNDSDGELAEAREIARRIGVPIHWVLTHTPGASTRYTDGSEALARLTTPEASFQAMTCDLRLADLLDHGGVARGRYLAEILPPGGPVVASPGERIRLPVELRLRAPEAFEKGALRLGVRLRSGSGRLLGELDGAAIRGAGGDVRFAFVEIEAPREAGRFQLFVDVVEEGVCWFHERGSAPAVVPLEVRAGERRRNEEAIVARLYRELLGREPDGAGLAWWSRALEGGEKLDAVVRNLVRGAGRGMPTPEEWRRLQRGMATVEARPGAGR